MFVSLIEPIFNKCLFHRVENKKKKEVVEDETKKKPKPPPKSTAVQPRIDATKYYIMHKILE